MTRRCIRELTEIDNSEDIMIYLVRNVEAKSGSEPKVSQKVVLAAEDRP